MKRTKKTEEEFQLDKGDDLLLRMMNKLGDGVFIAEVEHKQGNKLIFAVLEGRRFALSVPRDKFSRLMRQAKDVGITFSEVLQREVTPEG